MEAAATAIEDGDDEQSLILTSKLEPWLLKVQGDHSHVHIQKNSKKSPCHYEIRKNIPALVGNEIGCACYEWLVVTGYESPDCFILNLVTEEVIPLPSADFSYNQCILSSPPTDRDCCVVFFKAGEDSFFHCRPGDEEFSREEWTVDEFIRKEYAIAKGKIYFQGNGWYVVSIEFEQSACRLTKVELPWDSYRNVAGIQEADLSNNTWVVVESTAPLAIFITGDETGQMCCPTIDSKFKPNSIYFFEGEDSNLYSYDLADGSITMYPIHSSALDDDEGIFFTWMMLLHGISLPQIDDMEQNMSKELERCRLLDRRENISRTRKIMVWASVGAFGFDILTSVCKGLYRLPCCLLATSYHPIFTPLSINIARAD